MSVTTSFLILHGIENHRPPQHWQFLLAAGLVERGHEVRYPALPDPDAPELEPWLSTLHHELAALRGQQRVVVCHSLACLLWFRAAEHGVGSPVDRLLLVAPPASERVPDSGASFRLDSFDADAVRSSVSGEIAIACSDADPYNPAGAQSSTATRSASPPRSSKGPGTSRPTEASARGPSLSRGASTAGRREGHTVGAVRSQRHAARPAAGRTRVAYRGRNADRPRVTARRGRAGDGRHAERRLSAVPGLHPRRTAAAGTACGRRSRRHGARGRS